MNHQFYVYILANAHNTTLYIGMTNDLQRRVYEHKTHLNKGFTYRYNIDKLVWYEIFSDPNSAIVREKQLKKWNRAWKERIKNEMNPEWKDLSEEWFGDSRLRGNDDEKSLRGNDDEKSLRGNDEQKSLRGNDEQKSLRGNDEQKSLRGNDEQHLYKY